MSRTLRLSRMLHNLNEREARARDAGIQAEPAPEEISPMSLEQILSGEVPEDEPEGKNIQDYDPAYILDLARQLSTAVNETVELNRRGIISREEMCAHVLPLLKCSKSILLALQVAERRRGKVTKE